jgi:preprotein translocase subunit Sss1
MDYKKIAMIGILLIIVGYAMYLFTMYKSSH